MGRFELDGDRLLQGKMAGGAVLAAKGSKFRHLEGATLLRPRAAGPEPAA